MSKKQTNIKDYRLALKALLESMNADIGNLRGLTNPNVFFDEEKHTYVNRHTGEFYAGVSEILGVKNKGFMGPWAALETVVALGYIRPKQKEESKEEFVARAKEQRKMAKSILAKASNDPEYWQETLQEAKGAFTEKSKEAQVSGNTAHEWIEKSIHCEMMGKKDLPPIPEQNTDACNAIQSYRQWRDKNNIRFHAAELVVASDIYRYAGTLDALCTLNGRLTLLDFKTNKEVYPETFLQLEAYLLALEEMRIFPQWAIVLRLPKDGKQAEIYSNPLPPEMCRRTFLALREAKKFDVYIQNHKQ